jgi:hypothetical protein
LVVQKIERPALVRTLRQHQRRPGAECPLTSPAAANLKPLLGIKPAQLFVVQCNAFSLQQDMQPPIAEAPADRGESTAE